MLADDIIDLNDAILRLYDSDSLNRLLYFRLSKKLSHIASGNFVDVVFQVIQTAEEQGWILDLLTEIYRSHRTDNNVASLANKHGITIELHEQQFAPDTIYNDEFALNRWMYTGYSSEFISSLLVHPEDNHVIYAGTLQGSPNSEGHRLYLSNDGGNFWQPIAVSSKNIRNVNDIGYSKYYGKLLLAAESGLYVSTDNGLTWQEDKNYLDMDLRAVAASENLVLCGRGKHVSGFVAAAASIATSATENSKTTIFEPTSDDMRSGHLHISRDGGQTYITYPDLKNVNQIVVNELDPAFILFATSDMGVLRSFNSGTSVESCAMLPTSHTYSVASSPEDPYKIFAGTSKGLFRSDDAGDSWLDVSEIPNTEITAIKFSLADTHRVLVSSRFGVYESRDAGLTWKENNRGLSYLWSMDIAAEKNGFFFVGTSGGGVFRRREKAMKWEPVSTGFDMHYSFLDLQICNNWLLYGATGNGICRSQNGGITWQQAGYFHDRHGQLDRALTLACVPEPAGQDNNIVSDLFISADGSQTWQSPHDLRVRTLCVGTAQGNIYTSSDNGISWQISLDLEQLSERQSKDRVTSITYHPRTECLFATIRSAGLYKSEDLGESWRELSLGEDKAIPIAICIAASGKLFLGTLYGQIYQSLDDGENWELVHAFEDKQAVRQIAHKNNMLFLACERDQVVIYDLDRKEASHHNMGLDGVNISLVMPHMSNKSVLFAGTDQGVYISKSLDEQWNRLDPDHDGPRTVFNLSFATNNPAVIFAGASNGLFSLQTDYPEMNH